LSTCRLVFLGFKRRWVVEKSLGVCGGIFGCMLSQEWRS
jgi:hypothetical protein